MTPSAETEERCAWRGCPCAHGEWYHKALGSGHEAAHGHSFLSARVSDAETGTGTSNSNAVEAGVSTPPSPPPAETARADNPTPSSRSSDDMRGRLSGKAPPKGVAGQPATTQGPGSEQLGEIGGSIPPPRAPESEDTPSPKAGEECAACRERSTCECQPCRNCFDAHHALLRAKDTEIERLRVVIGEFLSLDEPPSDGYRIIDLLYGFFNATEHARRALAPKEEGK